MNTQELLADFAEVNTFIRTMIHLTGRDDGFFTIAYTHFVTRLFTEFGYHPWHEPTFPFKHFSDFVEDFFSKTLPDTIIEMGYLESLLLMARMMENVRDIQSDDE